MDDDLAVPYAYTDYSDSYLYINLKKTYDVIFSRSRELLYEGFDA